MIKGRRLRIEIDHASTTYRLVEGDQLAIYHNGEEIMVSTATPAITRPNPPPGVEPEPEFVDGKTGAR